MKKILAFIIFSLFVTTSVSATDLNYGGWSKRSINNRGSANSMGTGWHGNSRRGGMSGRFSKSLRNRGGASRLRSAKSRFSGRFSGYHAKKGNGFSAFNGFSSGGSRSRLESNWTVK